MATYLTRKWRQFSAAAQGLNLGMLPLPTYMGFLPIFVGYFSIFFRQSSNMYKRARRAINHVIRVILKMSNPAFARSTFHSSAVLSFPPVNSFPCHWPSLLGPIHILVHHCSYCDHHSSFFKGSFGMKNAKLSGATIRDANTFWSTTHHAYISWSILPQQNQSLRALICSDPL